MRRIGVDVGGTNTDAALLDGTDVIATAKANTTKDTVSGIVHSLQRLRQQSPVALLGVEAVMLGTTQFVNAVIEQQQLSKVFVLRLCGTATAALPPFTGLPADLVDKISAGYLLASGGYEYDGCTEISPLKAEADAAVVADCVLQADAAAVAVCGVHSPMNPAQELTVTAALIKQLQQRAPGRPVHVTQSHKLSGRCGLLEREAACILNASLQPLAAAVMPQYSAAMQQVGLQHVPLYLTGNDGTLLDAAAAQTLPILTFNSGPVNSVRGAAYLAGVSSALVCDIGGTSTDIGAVVQGMPRMAGAAVDVCGIQTNFQMPDVISFGLGGGSLVSWGQQQQKQQVLSQAEQQQQQQHSSQCRVGPSSVGSALTSSCLVCGGAQITASDVAVLLHDRLPHLVTKQSAMQTLTLNQIPSQQQLQSAWDTMQQMLADGIDAAKATADRIQLVVVGGAAGLCGDDLPGVSNVIRPKHADVANAIGAAIPQVAGTVDTLLHLTAANRQQQLAAAVQQATAAAVKAGAEPDSCEVTEIEEIPVAYGSAGAVRVHVKVAGKLRLESASSSAAAAAELALPPPAAAVTEAGMPVELSARDQAAEQLTTAAAAAAAAHEQQQQQQQSACDSICVSNSTADATQQHQGRCQHLKQYSLQYLQQYIPCINSQGVWEVSCLDLDALVIGAQLLGARGGGSARYNRLKLEHAIKAVQQAQAVQETQATQQAQAVTIAGSTAAADGASTASAPTDTAAFAAQWDCRNPSQLATHQQQQQLSGGCAVAACRYNVPVIMALADLPDAALVCDVGGIGAPTVSAEKLDSFECAAAVQGLSNTLPQPITVLLCAEVGGGNALEPLAVGLQRGLPVVDADLMGRAFPELQMSTAAIAGVSLTPAAVADDKGNVLLLQKVASPVWAEKLMRAACTQMGCTAGLASSPMTGKTAKQVVVPGSLSLAWHIGMAVLQAQAAKTDPVAALLNLYQGSGRLLFQGKVVDVVRHTEAGFVRGRMRIESKQQLQHLKAATRTTETAGCLHVQLECKDIMQQQPQQHIQDDILQQTPVDGCLVIEFQNENLVAKLGSCGVVVGCVPDLICVVESSTGHAVATEDVRYGLWVSVLLLPAHPLLRTPAAMQVVGPAAFGYAAEDDVVYQPVGEYPNLQTVHQMYGTHLSRPAAVQPHSAVASADVCTYQPDEATPLC